MAQNEIQKISIGNAVIGFRNFEGREGPYNKLGERSFAVFLDGDTARDLDAKGWNVKFPKDYDKVDPDQESRDPYLQVSLGFEHFPPSVYMISNGNATKLTEHEVAMLDWAELEKVDLVIRPYTWSVGGRSGIKAYLKSGYFTIATDEFAAKYGL
jgi:hypothetical protein